MTVREDGSMLRLEGDCGVHEAETLVALLQRGGFEAVDLGGCRGLHTAVVQALVAFAPPLAGASADAFLREHVAPALEAARGRQPAGQTIMSATFGHTDGPPQTEFKR